MRRSIAGVPGVAHVDVFLASEKAVIEADPELLNLDDVRSAVEAAGYAVPADNVDAGDIEEGSQFGKGFTQTALRAIALVFGVVLFVVVGGEWLGLSDALTDRIPWPIGVALVVVAWYPVLVKVVRAALRGQIISHTLMSVGVLAALALGQWITAAIVVFFMRVGDQVERYTAERARQAVKDLTSMAPQTARTELDGAELEIPVDQVAAGDIVIVRPGEVIPVDGQVVAGHATVDQAAITGESMPVEAGPGATVYAATIASLGSLRVRVERTGEDTTFGRVIALVEDAEANRSDVQRLADRFSACFLPFVAILAVMTFAIRQDPMATVAVLVVACSCSIALATPIAVMASIGAGAKHGVLIKGGKYLELLAKVDVLLIDKTGTLTLGEPQITDVIPMNGASRASVLALAGSAERYSEHPLAEAIRKACRADGISLQDPVSFEAIPGLGVCAQLESGQVTVGSARAMPCDVGADIGRELCANGKTLICVASGNSLAGVLAAADTLRSEAPTAIEEMRALGISDIELLTGDNEQTAAGIANRLGIRYRAGLLPEDKLAAVKEYQAQGKRVAMVGDGVNDAPALAQADVGIAMGAAGSSVAVEAAHIALMRDDWMLVPEAFHIAQRTIRVVKMNLGFTTVYNILGLSLAALGVLPPVLAAAAQSLPDLGILANSSRLLHHK